MVTERKEPIVSSVLDSQEEPASKRVRTPVNPYPQVITKKTSSPWVWVALLFALIAAGAAGFSYWQLIQIQAILQTQQGRVAGLENRLSLSDDESAQSLVAVSAQLKQANEEIRKLWGVSYSTNRKAISENKAAITSQEKNHQKLSEALRAQQSLLESSSQALSEQGLLIRTLRERVDEQGNNLQLVAASTTDFEQRTKDNEEAIEAFDVFRRSVSRDLLQIKQQVAKPSTAR